MTAALNLGVLMEETFTNRIAGLYYTAAEVMRGWELYREFGSDSQAGGAHPDPRNVAGRIKRIDEARGSDWKLVAYITVERWRALPKFGREPWESWYERHPVMRVRYAPPEDEYVEPDVGQRLVTIRTACAIREWRDSTVREWCRLGKMPGATTQVGSDWCIPLAVVMEFERPQRGGDRRSRDAKRGKP